MRTAELKELVNHKHQLPCSAQCPNITPPQALLMTAFLREGSAPPSGHSPWVKGLLTLSQCTLQLPWEDGIKLKTASMDKGLQTWQGMTGPGLPHTSCLHHSSSQKGSEMSRRDQEGSSGPDSAEPDRGPRPTCLPLSPLTSVVTAWIEGLRMGCMSLLC